MNDNGGRRRGNPKDYPMVMLAVQIVIVAICLGFVLAIAKGVSWLWSL